MVLMKYIRANRGAPLFMLFWQLLFFVIGTVIVLVINTFFNDDPDFAYMGTMFAMIIALVGSLARGNLNGHIRFQLAISMGNTRLSYLLCDPLITALTSAVGLLTTWIMYQGEKALYSLLYPGFENDIPLDVMFHWAVLLCIIAGTVLLDLVMSALMQRFDTKGFLTVWLGGCFTFMLLPRLVDAYQSGSTSLLARIGGFLLTAVTTISVKLWIAIGIILVLALLIFAVNTFRKAEVKL